MHKNYISAVGGAKTLPFNQETRNQPANADLKKRVLSEFGKWLRMDSQVPPVRKLYHPVAQALAVGQTEDISFEAAQQFATSNSIWLQTRVDAARIGLDEAAFLELLASNFADQSRLLERMLPVAGEPK
jgi:hypothetical protein